MARDTVSDARDSAGVTIPGLLSRLYAANTAEIQLSREAATKGGSPKLKRIARKLASDHSRNREEAQALVQKLDITLVPAVLGDAAPDSAAILPALDGKTRAAFDRAYLDHEIAMHQAIIEEIRNRLLPVTRSAEVRAYLQKTLTLMEDHLETLKQVRQQVG